MKTWQKVAVSIFIVTLLTLQVIAIIGPFDDWPFASNSMFGFYRTSDDPAYDLVILVDEGAGTMRPLDTSKDLGTYSGDSFRRLFFGKWYGSVDPSFPQGKYPGDSPAAFTARMADFCQKVIDVMRRRGMSPIAIRLEIQQMKRQGDAWIPQSEQVIGTYQAADSQFVLNPNR